MNNRPKREKIPTSVVLDWLQRNYPALHAGAEVDRAWVWLTAKLDPVADKAICDAIDAYGFRIAKHKLHTLRGGKLGTWAHACDKPVPFKRHGWRPPPGGSPVNSAPAAEPAEREEPTTEQEPEPEESSADDAALAFAMED